MSSATRASTGRPVRASTAANDAKAAEILRIIRQLIENDHRTAITDTDRVQAHQQLSLLGLSAGQIARRTGTGVKAVKAGLEVAGSELAAAAMARYDLTLDQAGVLTEFEDDTEAFKTLTVTAKKDPGQFAHLAQRLRDKRAEDAARAALLEQLATAQVTVIEIPGHNDRRIRKLRDLRATRPTNIAGAGWLDGQKFDPSTRESTERRLRLHVYPYLGDRELRRLTPSVVQAWLRGPPAGGLSPNTVRVVYGHLSALLTAAVDDGKIARNPCAATSVKPPPAEQHRAAAWPNEDVGAVRAALPARYQAIVDMAGGRGLRQGEIFGLAEEDVEWLRRIVHVRRQVKIVGSRLCFAPPKNGKERDVPLAESVSLQLAAHLAASPAVPVMLPWREPEGVKRTARLIFTNTESGAIDRNSYNEYVWKPALTTAGVPPTRQNGMHALRHWYASVQLDGGTSIRALAEHFGHADPGFTLRVYVHMMPANEDRSRRAVDRALASIAAGTGCALNVRRADT